MLNGTVDASVERSYSEDRIRYFRMTLPVVYQKVRCLRIARYKMKLIFQDSYLTHALKTQSFSLQRLIVFSPLAFILFLVLFPFSWKCHNVSLPLVTYLLALFQLHTDTLSRRKHRYLLPLFRGTVKLVPNLLT